MKTFFTSDHHFHHANILKFKDDEGNLIRPGFDDVEHMNQYMIERWNAVVGVHDKVYHLGDIIMRSTAKYFDSIMPHLNGRIVLIKGNHDSAKLSVYTRHFADVRSEIHMKTKHNDMVLFTHRPVKLSAQEFATKTVYNVHGHIHQNVIDDLRYINVSVERTNYTPLTWDEIQGIIEERSIR